MISALKARLGRVVRRLRARTVRAEVAALRRDHRRMTGEIADLQRSVNKLRSEVKALKRSSRAAERLADEAARAIDLMLVDTVAMRHDLDSVRAQEGA